MTNGDNSNILTARIARENYGIANVVARIYDPRRAVIYQRLGIPTVATVTWTATQVLRWLTPEDDIGRVARRHGHACCSSSGSCRTTGRAGTSRSSRTPGRIKVSSVVRSNQPRIDVAALIGQEDDVVQFVVLRDALERARPAAREGALMRVVIAGGGSVGTAIAADLLDNGHSVQILEQDPRPRRARSGSTCRASRSSPPTPARCRRCSARGCARPRSSSRRRATTRTTSSSAGSSKQEFAVPRVISRVNNSKNAWLFNESWGVDVSVSTPQLLTALVEEAVTIGSVVRLMELDRSGATLVEVTLDADAPALEGDTTVADLALPADAQIVAIVRDEKVLIPRDDTRLSEGDHVVVLATHGAELEIEKVFVGD